jgi:hypothetical protein
MKAPKQVGFEHGMYDYAGDDPALDEVESADDAFRELENEFQRVREWLVRRGFRNWHRQLGFLLRYMQMIRVRSPLYFEQRQAQGETLLASIIKEVHPVGETLTVSDPAPLSPHQIKNWTIANMREEIKQGAAWMEKFNWALRYTDSVEEPFVMTEAPLLVETAVLVNNIEEALQHEDSLIMFPICWQACLFGSQLRFHKGTDHAGYPDLLTFRRRYREHAKEFLLSPAILEDITTGSGAGDRGKHGNP